MIVTRFVAAVVLASVTGCGSAPPPVAFADVPVLQHALPGLGKLPSLRDGEVDLDIWLERDQADLLLHLGWSRRMTEAELRMSLSPSIEPPAIPDNLAQQPILIGPRHLAARAWNASGMEPLACVGEHISSPGANHGMWGGLSRYRIPVTGKPICVEITFNGEQRFWKISPVW